MKPDERYDSEAVSSDIARIREKLRRLDAERQSAVADLERAVRHANKRLPDDERPPAA